MESELRSLGFLPRHNQLTAVVAASHNQLFPRQSKHLRRKKWTKQDKWKCHWISMNKIHRLPLHEKVTI